MKTRKVWLFSAHMLPLLARVLADPHTTLLTVSTFSMGLTGAGFVVFLLSNLFVPYRLAKAAYSELLQVEVPFIETFLCHHDLKHDPFPYCVRGFLFLRWLNFTVSWQWESLCGTCLRSPCSSVSSGLFYSFSSFAPTSCPAASPQHLIRASCSSCLQGMMSSWCWYGDYNSLVQNELNERLCFTVCLNAVPHHTLSWVWPLWCHIWLLACSTCASSTWEVMQQFRMRTLCTGEVFFNVIPTLSVQQFFLDIVLTKVNCLIALLSSEVWLKESLCSSWLSRLVCWTCKHCSEPSSSASSSSSLWLQPCSRWLKSQIQSFWL